MFMTGDDMLRLLNAMTPDERSMDMVVQDRDTGTAYALHAEIDPVVCDEGSILEDEEDIGDRPINALRLRAV